MKTSSLFDSFLKPEDFWSGLNDMVGNYLCFSQLGLRESSWVEACHGAISRIERISIIPRFEIPYSFFLQTAPAIDQAIWGKNWYSIRKPVMIERQPRRDIFDPQNVFIIITTIDLFQKLKYLLLNKVQYLHSYWQIVQNFIINIS